MKKHKPFYKYHTAQIGFLIVIFSLSLYLLNTSLFVKNHNDEITGNKDLTGEKETGCSSETADNYFNSWFYPYGSELPSGVIKELNSELKKMPSEKKGSEQGEWRCIGPHGLKVGKASYYSGRILSIEQAVDAEYRLRIGSSTGGLWEYKNSEWIPLSDDVPGLNSLSISAFATKPDDANTIFIGTGDYQDNPGSGLFKTTDGGKSWTEINLDPAPTYFTKIKFTGHNEMHLTSDAGYYRSDDGGTTWQKKLSGHTTDLAISSNDKTLYTGIFGDGIYKSVNGGNDWSKLTSGGIPVSNVGRIGISMAASNNKIVYVAITTYNRHNPAGDTLLGIYKTIDDGNSWKDVRSNNRYIPYTGDYFNEIAANPKNPDIVIAAGIESVRSTDGGKSWSMIKTLDVHVDHKALVWSSDGKTIWDGNDGGLSVSSNSGANWNTLDNDLPITQFYFFDIGSNNHNIMAAGLQDNGFVVSTDGSASWVFKEGGDGSGASINPNNASNILGGIYNDIFLSNDYGNAFAPFDKGKDDCKGNPRLSPIRNDRGEHPVFYTVCSKTVYYTNSSETRWEKLNKTEFSQIVNNVIVTPRTSQNEPVVYVCFEGRPKPDPNQKLQVYDNGKWYERSTGLPSGADVRTVSLPYKGDNTAYALMNGVSSPGEKIFKTTNKGVKWENITGDLPELIAVGDLFPAPNDPDKLYLGTVSGFFRSTNGGVNWERWDNGMPPSLIISEIKYIDSTAQNGKFYIAAASYGRGIWVRNISDNDEKVNRKNEEKEIKTNDEKEKVKEKKKGK